MFGDLLEFLNTEGTKIIRVATQHGEGPACTTLLRKIRECAAYATRHEMGYLEASGMPMLYQGLQLEAAPDPEAVGA